MAKQIDKKWIADGAIDGSKIKLLEGQSLVIEVSGQPVELLKLNENGSASLPQGEVPSTQAVNDAIASEVTALSQEIAQDLQAVESGLAQEILDRQSAITTVEQSVAAETLARETAITSVEQSVQSAQTDISGLESDLAQEILDRQSGDASTLSSAQAYADQKVADLVNSAPEVLDTLKELSDALGGDANFATTVAGQIGAVDDKVDQEILDRQAGDSSLQSQISQEILDRQAGDSSLDARIVPMEEILEFQKAVVFENNANVIADGQPGVEDAQLRDGWYYQNLSAGQKINWYFFDGVNQANIQKQDFSMYAVVTLDSIASLPILALYTYPTGTNDIMPGFAHSRYVYSTYPVQPVVGKKYLMYVGQEPTIFPELPRLQVSQTIAQGEQLPTERVLTSSFGTNSGAAVGNVKLVAEHLGVYSPDYKGNAELKIRPASLVKLEAEEAARIAGDASLQSQIDGLSSTFATDSELASAVSALESADLALDQKIDGNYAIYETDIELVRSDITANSQSIAQEILDRQAGDSALDAKIEIEKGRIDAILSASEADKDSFAEIVALINSVDTENDSAFASYALSNDAAVSSLEDRVEVLEGDSDIIEVESLGEAPALGLVGKLYVAKDSNKLYRWATVGGGSLTFDKVVGSGEAFTTLESAIAAANDGENILVKAGTYLVSSTIAVNKQVKIVGEDKDLVIFETAATTSAPVSMFNVSVDNVALAKMTIKHKKTSNTSVETAVVASGGGFPQTRISNFIMENCVVEYAEFGVTVRAENWCVRDTTFTYATGSVSNSCRAIGIYGTKGNSFIKDVFLKNDVLNGTASRPFYLTSTTGSNPNETTSGKLVIEGTTHVGPLAQFFNQDNQQSEGAGTFELQIKNNVINETNLFAGFAAAAANSGDMFSSITLSGNTLSNLHAVDGGKGVFGVYGTAAFRTSALTVHASNNTLGQEVYRTGWMAVEGSTVGKETATPSFSVALDSIIPASGDAPQVAPSSSSSYVEVSPEPDLSGIESDISSLESADVAFDSRISALENAPDAVIFEEDIKFVVDGININSTYIDLPHLAKAVLKVGVNRLNAYKNQDYTLSVVGGVTRLTWMNDLAANGLSEIAGGDVIYVSYAR